jgi:hypothetical protein
VPRAPPPTPQAPANVAPVAGVTTLPGVKPGEPWDFPSAASIPPVSIMNKEPPAPKGAEASAKAEKPAAAATPTTGQAPPVPPKRPPRQAAPTPLH